ncbi:hypothetical protein LCM20_08560 [Halobacillus litoralis]|uniref:hypothetical protein n=1 Tax=Halobacillus litoralis TaxID=45668 RepID=UPI001CD57AA4|nr:hypothetical protein [Halobacillus litoralis]MCA0970636.1 hypothetical protein [Halobacillus litoralis]
MTKFSSNAEEIKHFTKELLADGQEYTRSEIIEYVIQQSGRNDFTEGNYSGSLNDLVRRNQIMIVKRGIYRLVEDTPSTTMESQTLGEEPKTLDKQCANTLNDTIVELQKIANGVDVLTISNEEQQTIEKIKKVITNLKVDIKLFEEDAPEEE